MKPKKKPRYNALAATVLGLLATLGQYGLVQTAGVTSVKLKTGGYHDETTELPRYEAVVGQKVELPCNLTSPLEHDSTSLILWYRGDGGAPIYSVDCRPFEKGEISPPNCLEKSQHFPTEVLGERGYFDVISRPAVLRIDPVQAGDGGEYRCRVDHRWARTHTTASILNVIVPPNDVAILNEEGNHVHGVIGPYNEGSSLNLICEADGGQPPPRVTWRRHSAIIDSSYNVTEKKARNRLEVVELKRTDLMAVFTCSAENNNLTRSLETFVTIDMNLKPVEVQITSPPQSLSAGKEVKMECRSTGSRPPVTISWSVDNKQLGSSTDTMVSMGNLTTVSELKFVPSAEDNEKKLVCHAENKKVPDSALTSEKKLTVYYIPRVTLTLAGSTKNQDIVEGTDAELTCNIQANPSVFDVSWKFQDLPLTHDQLNGIIITNQSLILQRIKRRQRGKYRCSAANIEGHGESDDFLLNISYTPICRDKRRINKGVTLYESVKLSCYVDADPPDVTFSWSLHSTNNGRAITTFSTDGIHSVATYVPKSQSDYGLVYCWARNSVGVQKEPCLYYITPAGPPDKLTNCTVTNSTSNGLWVECLAGHDGGLPQQFYLEVFNSDRNKIETNLSRTDAASFHIRDLPPSTSFVLTIYSANKKGRSNSVGLKVSTKATHLKQIDKSSSSGLNPLLVILLGVVVSLVLLAIIIVVIIKIRFKVQEKGPEEEHGTEKSQPLLTKETHFSSSTSEFKDPDVIPSKTDATDFCALQDNWPTLEINSQRDSIFTCSGYERGNDVYAADCATLDYPRNSKGRGYGSSTLRSQDPRDAEILHVNSLTPEDLAPADYRRVIFHSGETMPTRYQSDLKKPEMNSTPV